MYPEYIPPEDDVFPAEEQPLPAAASATVDSPGYIPESDPDEDLEDDDDEDPKEDPADYPADHDDDEEEEHPASADSIPPPLTLRVTARISFRPQPPTLFFTKEDAERADRPEVTLPTQKRLSIVHCPGYKARESLATAARPMEGRRADYGFVDFGRQMEIFQRVEALVDDSQYHYETGRLVDQEAIVYREAWAYSIGLSSAIHFELQGYMTHMWVQDQRIDKMALKRGAPRRTTRLNPGATPSTTTTTVTNTQLQAMIDQCVNAALAARDANRTGDDSHTSRTGVRRTERVTQECTYQDFMKCQPLYFKGTKDLPPATYKLNDTSETPPRGELSSAGCHWRVIYVDPHDTSLMTSASQRVNGSGRVATCHHRSGSTWHPSWQSGKVAKPAKAGLEPRTSR
nr:hypothetical protein [Tanacetum cinerariifolium]